MSELADYFSRKPNVEVHLVMYGIKPIIFYSLPQVVSIHKPPFTFNNHLRFLYSLKTLLYLRHEVKKIQPYSILSFGERFNSLVLLALIGKKFPIYISDRCRPNLSLGRLHNFFRWLLYPKSKSVIVQTITAKEIYQEMLPKAKLTVIGNPIRKISPRSEILRENIVLTVGRLIDSKHHDELIKLFVEIDMPDWKLIIVGDDAIKQQNKQRLQNLVKKLKFDDRIVFAGSQNDVDKYYLRSKIFAFTSSSEGFPNVIGEAMSAGLPVVAFDCIAGPSEMITNNKDGFLVQLFDYHLFKEKLAALMTDPVLRDQLGKEAKNSIKQFSSEIIGEKYFALVASKG